MKPLKTRLITGTAIFVAGVPLLLFSHTIIFPIAAGILALIAMSEIIAMEKFKKRYGAIIPTYILAFLIPFCAWFFKDNEKNYVNVIAIVIFMFLLYMFAYAVVMKGAVKFSEIALHFTAFTYVTVSFASIPMMRHIDQNGAWYVVIIFIASCVCDIAAYFVGRAIGKHKLIPTVSPKKTIEGAIGGTLFSVVCVVGFGVLVHYVTGLHVRYLWLAVIALVLAVVSQFGDLIASLMKREFGIKDFGKCFPGHGGIMDRTDSTIAVSPVLLAMILILPPFYV